MCVWFSKLMCVDLCHFRKKASAKILELYRRYTWDNRVDHNAMILPCQGEALDGKLVMWL